MLNKPFVTAMIIPTGVGASIGGFAGDATPQMNLLASLSDVLITHPNVANAAGLQKLPSNALYVEGYALDQFFKNEWTLQPVRRHRIGVILDRGMATDMRILHENTINAVKTVHGLDILPFVETAQPVEVRCEFTASGTSSGSLTNPDSITDAAQKLIAQGATAIALCVQMPELSGEDAYAANGGVDPVGGIEAILSHLIVSEFQIPCAHSPVFSLQDTIASWDTVVDPRAAAEFITPTFLPCVLTGVAQAPNFINVAQKSPYDLSLSDLNALVVPANALGGIPVLAAIQNNIPVIAVTENQTVLNVDVSLFEAPITIARSYAEAAGLLQALKLGLQLPTLDVKQAL